MEMTMMKKKMKRKKKSVVNDLPSFHLAEVAVKAVLRPVHGEQPFQDRILVGHGGEHLSRASAQLLQRLPGLMHVLCAHKNPEIQKKKD
jgi:hypothetical protein